MQVQVSLKVEIAATANLTQMEQQIQEAGQQAMREALKQAIRHWEDQHTMCPHCGQPHRRLEGTVRRMIATVFGRVQVQRRRFRCQRCGHSFCPANGLLAELRGGTISVPLQEAAMLAGCSWPYRVAASTLKRLCGAVISAEEIRLLTNQHGQQRAEQQQAEAEQACSSLAEEAPSAQNAEQPILVRLDGGWVCSREQRGGQDQESGGRLFPHGRAADADLLPNVFLERARSAAISTATTASPAPAALCGDVWSIATTWTTGQSCSTEPLC